MNTDRHLPLPIQAARILHMGSLLADAGAGATQVAGEIHAGIKAAAGVPDEIPAIYPWLRLGFIWIAHWLSRWPMPVSGDNSGKNWQSLMAVTQGVVGDHLHGRNSALEQPMQLLDRQGRQLDVATAGGGAWLVHVHGLCMSARAWENPRAQAWMDAMEMQGYQVACLRYNSGLSIPDNGQKFSALMQQLHPTRLVLVGHSMGGLVMRAAYQQEQAVTWLPALRMAAYLGSPHQGAPLERLGEQANRLLTSLRMTAPLKRLGDLRSQGIKDLRHGHVGEAGQALPEHATHLLFAAELEISRSWGFSGLGDGLVPVRSALGQDLAGMHHLQGGKIIRRLLRGRHHMQLLSDDSVYETLSEQINAYSQGIRRWHG